MEWILYPLIGSAIFFESFLLVTYLSKPARLKRLPALSSGTPSVAIIVPVWNEESTVQGTVESLLALDYPADKLSIILVNDGSVDGTRAVIDRFAAHPQITALHKENGGKFSAMNAGLAHATEVDLVGFLDADSFVAPDALQEIIAGFDADNVVAMTASMSIHEPHTLLQRMQYGEYVLAIAVRHILASLNGLYVTPGPFSFYRRSLFKEIGLFKHAYLAEDMEMAMRIQRAGYQIGNAVRARVYTKGPPTLKKLVTQRVRWTTGFIRNTLFDYRDLFGLKRNALLGLLVLPLGVMAIVGSVLVFAYSCVTFIQSGWHAVSVARAAPLSYAFVWHPVSWYDLPLTVTTVLGLIMGATTLTWMVVGKQDSRTPGRLTPNLIAYLALYWLVAPLWLIRSVSEVVRGTRTTWR